MEDNFNHPGIELFMKYQTDWLTLSKHQKEIAKAGNTMVYIRYMLSNKYGKHLYNYLTNGGVREIPDDYVVIWDSEKDQ